MLIEYMSLFRRPSRLSGERHYYLVQLQTAVAFIDHMDAQSLTIDPDVFHAKYAEAEAAYKARAHKAAETSEV
jgi:hydroxypyruvate isomerase